MMPEPEPETVPEWVLTEVGRLHLDNLALRRELAAQDRSTTPPPS